MKKGQVATEYLVIVGFALIALIPLLLLYADERSRMESMVYSQQARQIARQIVDASETVYYLGPPSKTTLKVYMPSNVDWINITSNNVILGLKNNGGHIAEESLVPLSGSLPKKSGIMRITIEAQPGGVLIS